MIGAATRCPHCDRPVVNVAVAAGPDPVMFDPEPVPGGAWQWDADAGVMRRPGAGPRGYMIHARTCPAWQG